MNLRKGFSLIEMMVVMSIVAVLGTTLVLNFRSSSTNAAARRQSALAVASDIRRIQSMALSGSKHEGIPVCGFGVHYIDPTRYEIFAHVFGGASCNATTYQIGDPVIETKSLTNTAMRFLAPFEDVYFEVPFAKAYLDGSSTLGGVVEIEIVVADQTSGTLLSMHQSGSIDIDN